MEHHSVRYYQIQNYLHSILLLAGMLGILAFIGWLISGATGALWSLAIGGLLVTTSPRISPYFILRLYNAIPLSPAQAPEIYQLLSRLADRASLPYVPKLFYMSGQVMHAFTIGQRENTCIVLSEAMLGRLDARELTGVLAHEISHICHHDIWVMSFADILSRLTRFLALTGYLLILIYLPQLLFTNTPVPWLLLLILIVAPNLSALLQLALSRSREYSADLEAAHLTGDPLGLASALKKIEYYQGSWFERILFPGRKSADPSLLRTHPVTEERIKRLIHLAE